MNSSLRSPEPLQVSASGNDPLRVLSLFAGIGGFDLGLERTGGFKTVAFAETDSYASRVLATRFPGVPNLGDVSTAEYPDADVIVGGFPCQDISKAGKGAGLAGARSGLWRELVRAIRLVRPRYTIVENVAKLLGRGMGTVLGDLAESGHDAEWDCIPAATVGAPDLRDRVWIIAQPQHPDADSLRPHQAPLHVNRGAELRHEQERKPGQVVSALSRSLARVGPKAGRRWNPEPGVRRVVDGSTVGVDRLKCLGRAVKPIIPELIGRAILAARDSDTHRMAETRRGSGRSLSSAVPERQSPILKSPKRPSNREAT